MALALLPLAILCTWLALEERQYRWFVASGTLMGSLVLVNAFAAVDLVLALACLAAAVITLATLSSSPNVGGTPVRSPIPP